MLDLQSLGFDSFASPNLRIDSYVRAASATAIVGERRAAFLPTALRGVPRSYEMEITSDLHWFPDLDQAAASPSWSVTSEEKGSSQLTSQADRFYRELLAKLEAEPVEDGFVHAGEEIIKSALQRHGVEAQRWIETFLEQQGSSHAAAALKCLGRIPSPGSLDWRLGLLDRWLAHPSTEIRDAAVQAAELWADPGVVEVLRRHQQQREPWLRDYIQRVIRDLSE